MEISLRIYPTLICAIFISFVNAKNNTNAQYNDDDESESFDFLLAGGLKVYAKLYHYTVSLRTAEHIEYWGDNHFCAGVIISSKSVLTAAHCLVNRRGVTMHPKAIRIVAGQNSRLDKPARGHEMAVASIEIHPNYKRYEQHDIALIRLKTAFIKSTTLHEAKLRKHEPNYKRCYTVGWGQVYQNGPYSNYLLYTTVEIADHQSCLIDSESYSFEFNICGYTFGYLCRGDFGAPLVCEGLLMGIFGAAKDCYDENPYVKFTNIIPYIDWINRVKNGSNLHLEISMSSISYLLINVLLSLLL